MVRETVAIETLASDATPRISILAGVVASEDLRVRFKGLATLVFL
jgi:hypothetical protein